MKNTKAISLLGACCMVVSIQAGVFTSTAWVDDSSLPFSPDQTYTHAIDFAGANGSFDINGVTITQKAVGSSPIGGTDAVSGLGYTIRAAADDFWTVHGELASTGVSGPASTELATGMISYWDSAFPFILELQGLEKNTDYVFIYFKTIWSGDGHTGGRQVILDGSDDEGNAGVYQAASEMSAPEIIQYAYNTGSNTTFTMTIDNADDAANPQVYSFANRTEFVASPYDFWAVSKGLTEGVNDSKDADPDGDGKNNLREFACDGDPLISDANDGKMLESFMDVGGTSAFSLTFPTRSGAIFSGVGSQSATVDGVAYTVLGYAELTAEPDEISELQPSLTNGMPVLNGGWEYKTFWTPSDESQRFIKLTTDLP